MDKDYCEKQKFFKGPEQHIEFESEEIKLNGIAQEVATEQKG